MAESIARPISLAVSIHRTTMARVPNVTAYSNSKV